MQYKQNIHILLPVDKFEELKTLTFKFDKSLSVLVREGVNLVIKKYKRKGFKESGNSNIND